MSHTATLKLFGIHSTKQESSSSGHSASVHPPLALTCGHRRWPPTSRSAVPRAALYGHGLGIEHLLRQLGPQQSSALLRVPIERRSEARPEVQARTRDHVHLEFAKLSVHLPEEPAARKWYKSSMKWEVLEATSNATCHWCLKRRKLGEKVYNYSRQCAEQWAWLTVANEM